jgi:hypothetical protein
MRTLLSALFLTSSALFAAEAPTLHPKASALLHTHQGPFVNTASYGDGVTGYIPLEHSFIEGGYEPTQAYAAPESEKVMKETIAKLLRPAFQ